MGAIGVFDSGVGGLSVLREIRRELPHERLLYVADSGHAPYGDKSEAFIVARSLAIAAFLHDAGATSLVVACNTATAAAVDALRSRYTLPIVGIEPGVKPAVQRTQSGVVGVLTTTRTAASERFRALVERHGGSARVVVQSCPGWVELVERGSLDGPETRRLVAEYVTPLRAQGADVFVIGCTHYGYLAPVIRDILGRDATLIDPAPAVARHLRHRLELAGLTTSAAGAGEVDMWTSASPEDMRELVGRLWGVPATFQELPDAVSHP